MSRHLSSATISSTPPQHEDLEANTALNTHKVFLMLLLFSTSFEISAILTHFQPCYLSSFGRLIAG